MKLEAVLNIKAIIRFEQISGKPFAEIDYSNTDDLNNLLYSAAICSSNSVITREEFDLIIKNEQTCQHLIKCIEKHNEVVSQFFPKGKNDIQDVEFSDSQKFISDAVYDLIADGVDPKFIYDMWICDFLLLAKAYNQKKKEQMESSRLWTYLTILPHIGSKKIKSPVDLFPFPWEIEEIEKKEKERQEKDEEIFYKFMNGEIKFN